MLATTPHILDLPSNMFIQTTVMPHCVATSYLCVAPIAEVSGIKVAPFHMYYKHK